uniref:Uncharacterized protein n=1 Tax=Alexandrium andersonii TaxID=327968 RepID=A0A7S2DD47_9DINO|mmetsp:Transcript_51591/g.116728  ORF Transcript_51591/g.116728 Transcript_51591/m.116728 type:complete len:127 (+) Transcript_51591:73-453(+)
MAGTTRDESTMQMMGLLPVPFETPTAYEGVESVMVRLDLVRGGKAEPVEEEVLLDPMYGPKVLCPDGSMTFLPRLRFNFVGAGCGKPLHMDTFRKGWRSMTVTEQTVHLHTAARKNRAMRERLGLV